MKKAWLFLKHRLDLSFMEKRFIFIWFVGPARFCIHQITKYPTNPITHSLNLHWEEFSKKKLKNFKIHAVKLALKRCKRWVFSKIQTDIFFEKKLLLVDQSCKPSLNLHRFDIQKAEKNTYRSILSELRRIFKNQISTLIL